MEYYSNLDLDDDDDIGDEIERGCPGSNTTIRLEVKETEISPDCVN